MRFPLGEQPAVYEKHYLPMQNRLGATLTEFMRHFLGAEGVEVRKTDVYSAIKRLVVDSDSASVRTLMDRMERLSVLYSRLSGFAPEADEELSVFSITSSDWISGAFTHCCYRSTRILTKASLPSTNSAVRCACCIPSSFAGWSAASHRLAVRCFHLALSDQTGDPVTPTAWLAATLGKELKNRRWPSDAEFEERWTRGQIYGSRACQIILESLESQYEHHEPAPFTETQIEHVMPQTLTPDWENRLGVEATRVHADWLAPWAI